jgi:steroid delta-isomerase
MTERLDALVHYFEGITEATVPQLRNFYAPDAYFKDPFNEVHTVHAIEEIFSHMFGPLSDPKFIVHTRIEQGDEAFITWDFRFRINKYQPNVEQIIRGGSNLRFDAQNKVAFHRDYWDAAEELYEKLPLIGGLMRFMKRKMA